MAKGKTKRAANGHIELKKVYVLKRSGKAVPARVLREIEGEGYEVELVETNQKVMVRSASSFSGLWPDKTMPLPAVVVSDREEPKAKGKKAKGGKKAAKAAEKVDAAAKKPKVAKVGGKKSGLDVAAEVLKTHGKAMKIPELVCEMIEKQLWTTTGKTPAATIYAAVIREIADKGDAARFARGDERGTFVAR